MKTLPLLVFVIGLLSVATPASADILYSNGPILGQGDAWSISFGSEVTDSFTVTGAASVTGFDFVVWNRAAFPPRSLLLGRSERRPTAPK
jgi:hypothetical protein